MAKDQMNNPNSWTLSRRNYEAKYRRENKDKIREIKRRYRQRKKEREQEMGWPDSCRHKWDVSTGGAHPIGTVICVYCGTHKADLIKDQ